MALPATQPRDTPDTPRPCANAANEAFILRLTTEAVVTTYCEMVGREAAMRELAKAIGTDETGPALPEDAGRDLAQVREIVTEWSGDEISSDNAIEAVLRILSDSAIAEDPDDLAAWPRRPAHHGDLAMPAPIQRVVHYVGFRGDEFTTAFRLFGGPVMIHRTNDVRTQSEIDPDHDLVIYANAETEDRVRDIPGQDVSGPGWDRP
jgi:hypothetical protein